jgi:hypothetical protein
LSFEDGIEGAEPGANAADLQGCFSLSNSISVFRTEVTGGFVTTVDGDTEIEFNLNDSIPDIYDFSVAGEVGTNFTFVVTDDQNNILAVPDNNTVDFSDAGPGICRVWGLAYEGNIIAEAGDNAGEVDLADDCFSLSSNFVTVTRVEGLQGGNPTTFLQQASSEVLLDANLYPNPVSDQLQIAIETNISDDEPLQLDIVNLNGQVVRQQRLDAHAQTVVLDIANLEGGTYFFRLQTAQKIVTKRFIKLNR